MQYVAMILLILAILSGLIGFAAGGVEGDGEARLLALVCGLAAGLALLAPHFRKTDGKERQGL